MPSSRAARRAISLASAGSTWITPSSSWVCRLAGTKPAPMPWIGCGPGCAAGDDRRQRRLDREDLAAPASAAFSTSAQPVMWPPVPTPVISTSIGVVGEVGQDLLRRGADVDLDIGRVLELLRDPRARRLCRQFLRALDRALHALLARGEVEGRAIGEHQPPPLERHRFGHDQDQLVALHRRDHGQADAGVAAGRLDDRAAGLRACPTRFGLLDHRQRDAVLDRAAGIGAFGLDPHLGVGEQAREADVRRAADRLEDAVRPSCRSLLSGCVFEGLGRIEGARVRAVRGTSAPTAIVTTIAPTPPATTAATGPISAARKPDSASPSSFEAETNSVETAPTRPRISSGVWSWISDWRT